MSSIGGANIVKNRLLLGYDIGGSRFYPGEPTVNLSPNVHIGGVAGITISYITIENGWKKYSISGTWASGSYPYCMALDGYNFTGGAMYSSSCIVKTNVLGKFDYKFAGMNYVNQPMDYGGTSFSIMNTDGEVFVGRYGFQYTSTTTQSGYLVVKPLADGTSFSADTDFVWLKNAQIEQKSHVTPYVNGTRSATQSLLDLAGTYSLDVSSLLFDSVAQPYFNGSNYISVNINSWIRNAAYISISGWYYHIGNTLGAPWGILTNVPGTAASDGFWWHINYSGDLYLRTEDSTNGEYDGTYTPFVSAGHWYHIVTIVGTNKFDVYLNGSLYLSWSPVFSWSLINSDTAYLTIGYSYSEGVNGYVKQFALYDRALTASEVLQNYNAHKGRFV